MIPIKKILCPVDFSDAMPFALRPALSLAEENDAELVLLHVLKYPYPYVGGLAGHIDVDSYYDSIEEVAKHRLDALRADHGKSARVVHTAIFRGVPDEVIVGYAGDENVDLIVLPTHARTGVEHWLIGSVAEKIVRTSPCPVLTVSPRQESPQPFHPSTILFATDFSEHANRALPAAVELAEHYGAELVMIHVVTVWNNDPANPDWRFPELPEEHREAIEEAVRLHLDASLASIETDHDAIRTRHVRGFDPGLDLVEAAREEGADLIVLATHGRLGLGHMLIGSTAEKVIRYAECPVLSIKPAG
ncbi:MAG: universal stress protein [Acidobacteriota bacterium]|jgi:nucleotide-binding universal stress UspA family protein